MSKGFDIRCDDPCGVSRLIDSLGTGIPTSMGLRELGVNAIEACERAPEGGKKAIYVYRDHINPKKLNITNVGGDYLSVEKINKHLAAMASSGNIRYSKNNEVLFDQNKGCGAKIAVLPHNREGMTYRSRGSKDDECGITFTMMKDDRNIYTLPSQYCNELDGYTSYPSFSNFSALLRKSSGTEVVIEGNHPDEDTWVRYDRACGIRKGKGDGGTGYGIYKYFNHRFFDKPKYPFKVRIYSKKPDSKKHATYMQVIGLKAMIHEKCKFHGSFALEAQGVKVTAHWGVLYDQYEKRPDGKSGYVSNWASYGLTAFAWRKEAYFDFLAHKITKRRDVKECGIPLNPEKVLVVFELADDANCVTNAQRTEFYVVDETGEEVKLEKSLFHEEFSKNLPQEIVDWMRDSAPKFDEKADIDSFIKNEIKSLKVSYSKTNKKSGAATGKYRPAQNKSNKGKKLGKNNARANSNYKLRNFDVPEIITIDNEEDPVCEFNFNGYSLSINKGHPIFKHRLNSICQHFDTCLVQDKISTELVKYLALLSIERIIEIDITNPRLSLELKKEKWAPEKLESCWARQLERQIAKKCKKVQALAITTADKKAA